MYRIQTNPRRLLAVVSSLALALALPLSADEQAEKTVDQFLSRLGLTDVQILHLERQFSRSAGKSRLEFGRQLADLYAQRLMEASDDPDVYKDIVARVDKLVREVPEANTPALQVMLLQADYNRAEKRILEWINDRQQSSALSEAKEILERIAPQLDQHWRELAKQAEKLNDEIGNIKDEEAQELKDQELLRLKSVLGRASFFAGWSNFYYGIAKQNRTAAKGSFEKGRDGFRQLLGLLKEDKYEDIEADWLGLESIWRARALIGLGLCETALDHLDAAKICFKLLDHINTPPEIRDQAPYWFVTGLLETGQVGEAVEFSREQVEKYSGGATQGKVSFCVALIRAEYADPDSSTQETRKLANLGINGLARLRQLGVLSQLMKTYKIKIDADAGFHMAWVRGQQQFEAAEKTKEKSSFEAAVKTLENALKQPDARTDLAAGAQCRFILAWCRFRLGETEESAKQFLDAMPALKESGETHKAIQATWMAFAAYHGLARGEKRFIPQAIDAANTLKQEFPNSDESRRVDYYLQKLRSAAGKPEDRVKALKAVGKDDPNYVNAQYEICLLQHEIWSGVREDKLKAPAAVGDVLAAVDQYLAVAKASPDDLRKLKAGLLAVDVSLRSTPPDAKKANSYLTMLQPFADTLPKSSSSVAEFHYRLFQLARLASDAAAQQREAEWLLTHAQGTVYERSTIITLARLADEAVEKAAPADRPKRVLEAIAVYQRLVEIFGDSPEAIKANKNAQVANSAVARYQFATGRFVAAAQRLDALLAVFPKNRDYLQRAGLATFHAKMYEPSLGHWRVLLAGLSKGSSEWYEAKYHQLQCLLNTDKNSAKKVYRQFKLLYPTISDETWRSKFGELDRQLGD